MRDKTKDKTIVKIIIIILSIVVILLISYKTYINKSVIQFYLNGSNEVSVEYGSKYKDSGFISTFNKINISKFVQTSSNLNTNKIGDYEIKYNLKLKFLNYNKQLIRRIHVIDSIKPVLDIKTDSDIYIDVYSNFEFPKYTSIDNVDGDITSLVKIESNLNVNKVGDYELIYRSIDSSNNEAIKKIIVHVEPKYKNAYINISINNQKLEYYERGKLILSSDIVTGAYNSTPVGSFKVLNKSRNVSLKGKDYVSYVNYWIAFKGYSYGMHDASWRNSFGSNIYQYNGSHGCVNMPYNKVKELYNLVEIGTPVYINY